MVELIKYLMKQAIGGVLDKYSTIGSEVWNSERGALSKRKAIGKTEDGLRFASNVLGVRPAGTGEEHPITHLFKKTSYSKIIICPYSRLAIK